VQVPAAEAKNEHVEVSRTGVWVEEKEEATGRATITTATTREEEA